MDTAPYPTPELVAAVERAVTAALAKQQPDPQRLYSINSFARAMDVSRAKVYDLMSRGLVRYIMLGADRRIPASELDRLASEGIAPSKVEAKATKVNT